MLPVLDVYNLYSLIFHSVKSPSNVTASASSTQQTIEPQAATRTPNPPPSGVLVLTASLRAIVPMAVTAELDDLLQNLMDRFRRIFYICVLFNVRNEELNDLYSSPNIVRVIKSKILRWAGHVARMGERRGVYMVMVGKPEGTRPLGRPRHRWEDNIKMDLQDVGCGAYGLDRNCSGGGHL